MTWLLDGMNMFPFSFMQYEFMKYALLAAVCIAPLFGLLGTMAVNNKMAFFSDALGHSAFTGIGIGALLGLQNPILSMLAFGIFLSLVITKVKAANKASADTIISVFSSGAMALGIVILSKNGGFAKYSNYLVGDILTVTAGDVYLLFLALLLAYIVWAVLFNQLLLVSVNRSLAVSRGVNAAMVENVFVVMVAIAVMLAIRCVGILAINSLLILPAAAPRNIAGSAKGYHAITTAFGFISAIGGIILSYYIGTSAGATMVLVAVILFFITYAIGTKR